MRAGHEAGSGGAAGAGLLDSRNRRAGVTGSAEATRKSMFGHDYKREITEEEKLPGALSKNVLLLHHRDHCQSARKR